MASGNSPQAVATLRRPSFPVNDLYHQPLHLHFILYLGVSATTGRGA